MGEPDFREWTVELGEVELAVAEAGRGGRPLLLVHGFTGAKEDFGDWLVPFAEAGFHVVAADHRGHGASGKPTAEESYSLGVLAEDQLRLADHLGWGRFSLLGHSMGGAVAQVMAVAHPERLERLVLMDTWGGVLPDMDPGIIAIGVEIARTQGLAPIHEILTLWEAENDSAPAAQRRLMAERSDYAEWSAAKFLACAPAMWAALITEMVGESNRLEGLAGLDLPTLVMVGDQDERFLGASAELAATIPGARYSVIPDAGHSPQFEAPAAWWSEVSAFLGVD